MAQYEINFLEVQDQDIVFDLDGTLIMGDIGESAFLHLNLKELLEGELHKKTSLEKIILAPDQNRYQFGIENITKYLDFYDNNHFELALRYTSDEIAKYNPEEVYRVVKGIMGSTSGQRNLQLQFPGGKAAPNKPDYSTSYGVVIRDRLIKLVEYLKGKGARLWIVSASPQYVVDACGSRFGFNPGNVFGAVPEGSLSDESRFPWGAGKAKVLKESGVEKPLITFGNGLPDLEMLKLSKYPIVMGDGHPELVAYAKQHNWDVFSNQSEFVIDGKLF